MSDAESAPAAARPDGEAATREKRPERRRLTPPVRWLVTATIIALAYAICYSLGMRESVSVICATSGATAVGTILAGLTYGLLFLATVIVCPILVLAAGFHFALSRLATRRFPSL
jgi:hypothetical protein